MKVQVKDLKPNPFRKIEKYPINKEKVNGLKISINETTFWDNLLARKKNGDIQIAYGHHRMIALKELGIKEVDIPVRDLDDGQMIRIMANENLDDWKATPAIYTETVLVAKEYLDGELAKYETYDQVNKNINLKNLIPDASNFGQLKKNGVGQTTLGGNWKQWIIQDALNTLKDKDISRAAVGELPKFKSEVKKYNIPKGEQIGLAKQIKKEGVGKRAVADVIKEHARVTGRIKKEPKEPKPRIDIEEFVEAIITKADTLVADLFKMVGNVQYISSSNKDTFKSNLNVLYEMIEKIRKEF